MTDAQDQALQARVSAIFNESAAMKTQIAAGEAPARLVEMARICATSIKNGGKVMFCGNGGSAADAQHLAAEMLVRLRSDRDRDALPALTLAQDTSTLTACSNDYGFHHIYERPLRAIGREGDVLVGISTTGQSENVTQALLAAREMGISVLGFLGGNGGKALALCDVCFIPPATSDTGRIQEAHITAGHALVELTEDLLEVGA